MFLHNIIASVLAYEGLCRTSGYLKGSFFFHISYAQNKSVTKNMQSYNDQERNLFSLVRVRVRAVGL